MATNQTAGESTCRPRRRPAAPALVRLLVPTVLLIAAPAATRAATIEIDTTAPGSSHDAILDGFPGLAPYDGFADFGGNALAVSLKDGVTEERAFVELPLAPLVAAGVGVASIASARVVFNVDDVLSTFGPGTDFDGTAGERILVSVYPADGTVGLDDYTRGVPVETVQVGAGVTDATLASSGPLAFAVDVTAELAALLGSGATHVGIAFATDDSPTGTSIDDLGNGGGGAPGGGGARLPYLRVETIDATPTPAPTPSPAPTAAPTASPGATPSPAATSTPRATATAGVTPTPPPAATPTPLPTSTAPPATPAPTPGQATPTPASSPGATATPAASVTPSTTPSPDPSTTPDATPTPGPGATATPGASASPLPSPTPRPILTPRPTATPETPTPAPSAGSSPGAVVARPAASGDQLVLFYDARSDATTFLNLHNLGAHDLAVRVLFYGGDLARVFEERLDLGAGATRTLDVTALRARGLAPEAGVAFAEALDGAGSPVVSRSLAGSFTVANLATSSAWGAPAAARRAVRKGSSAAPARGARIDGTAVALESIRPQQLQLSVYYDPATLAPAERGGSLLVLLSFAEASNASDAAAAATTWTVAARRSDGTRIDAPPLLAAGVLVTHLEAILGAEAAGAAGSVTFIAERPGAANRLVYFAESLGTFATGYLLPHVASPEGATLPTNRLPWEGSEEQTR